MADKDKPAVDKPAADDTPVADEPKAEEPAGDEPASSGKDQYGRQLFSVNCASCGNQAQVPFKPSGDRPVYCRDCYMQQRRDKRGGGGGMGRGPRR